MDAEDREQVLEIEKDQILLELMDRSRSFSFVQALRLLIRYCTAEKGIDPGTALQKFIRIRPELSLNFPGTDITRVEPRAIVFQGNLQGEEPESGFLITATFLGLYGSSSPLPNFYTEDLIDEFNEAKSIKRDFLDIINYALYPIFFKIWSKHRLFYKICEEEDPRIIEKQYSLLGLEDGQNRSRIRNIDRYFRYTGLTLQFPRSAEGLEAILADGFSLQGQVAVEQCVQRRVRIPQDQHALLGISSSTLGEDSVIGTWIKDMAGKFSIRIKEADARTLHEFLPDQDSFYALRQLVEFYVNQPLEWDLVVEVRQGQIQTTQPGNGSWSHLGWNTWLVMDEEIQAPRNAVFCVS